MVRIISGQLCPGWSRGDTRFLVLANDHWFAVHVVGHNYGFNIYVHGFPFVGPDAINAFIHAVTTFLGIQVTIVRVFFQGTLCPWHMCGFVMLRELLRTSGLPAWPTCDAAVRYLQAHREHERIESLGHSAVQAWSLATDDQELIMFAFTVRALFLSDLLQYRYTVAHETGGTLPTTQAIGHSHISSRTRDFLANAARVHRPVHGICRCHTRGFSAQAIVKSYIQDWGTDVLASCAIVAPTHNLPDKVGDLFCGWPECGHTKTHFAHLLLAKEVWETFQPQQTVLLTEVKLLWTEGVPVVDLRSPQSGITPISLQRDVEASPIRVGEFFAGGFSGWSFALKALQEFHLPLHQAFAVENDLVMARNHALNHAAQAVITDPKQAKTGGAHGV